MTTSSPSTGVETSDAVLVPPDETRTGVDGALISEIFEQLAQYRHLPETLEAIARAICTHLGVHFCAIILEHPEADLLIIEGAAGFSPSYVEAINQRYPLRISDLHLSEGPSSQAFRASTVVVIEDYETDPTVTRWRALAREQGYRSVISLPLRSKGQTIGTLNCYQSQPRRYVPDEVRTLTMAATQVGIAIEIARLVERQRQTINKLERLTRELNEQRRLLERTAQVQTALTQLVLNNQGVPAIAAALARVVGCAVLVQDQFYQTLAGATEAGEPTRDLSPLTREALALSSSRTQRSCMQGPFEVPANAKHGLDNPRAIAPIIAGHNLLGYVSLVLRDLPAPPLHLRALGQAATVLALEMVKERLAHEVELRVRRGFGDDLVSGRYDDAEQMRDRARYLGYDLTGPFQVLVFDIDHFGHYVAENRLSESDIDAVRRQFSDALIGVARHHRPRAIVAGRHDRLSLILPQVRPPADRTVDAVIASARAEFAMVLPGMSISIGIGQCYDELDDVRTSYQQALQSLHIIRRLGGTERTLRYTELGITRLLMQVENTADLIGFARKRLAAVLRYDQQHGGILMQALEAYLAANQSVARAAHALDLHPNTLRYRLRRAEELLATSLTDISMLLDLQFACLVLRLSDCEHVPDVNH